MYLKILFIKDSHTDLKKKKRKNKLIADYFIPNHILIFNLQVEGTTFLHNKVITEIQVEVVQFSESVLEVGSVTLCT